MMLNLSASGTRPGYWARGFSVYMYYLAGLANCKCNYFNHKSTLVMFYNFVTNDARPHHRYQRSTDPWGGDAQSRECQSLFNASITVRQD